LNILNIPEFIKETPNAVARVKGSDAYPDIEGIVIHSSYDDFTSQPAGGSGTKIACGVIE